MHIPDNYLSPTTCGVLAVAMLPVWAYSIKRVKEETSRAKLPLLGVCAAFSFLAMMFNIPLPGGTTGHAVGGTLLAILMGPFSACISVTVALLIQALFFGDGGILAFSANCFNMAFVLPFSGYFVYKFFKSISNSEKINTVGIFLASYIGINMAALFASFEFGIQPLLFKNSGGQPLYCPYPLSIAVPAMMLPHLLAAGFVEGIFTLGIYTFIKKVSPGLFYEAEKSSHKAIYALLAFLIFLTPLGILASGRAWGEWGMEEIEHVITNGQKLGFIPEGMKNGFNYSALFSEYQIKGLPEQLGYFLTALLGVAALLIVFKIVSIKFMKKNVA